VNVMTAATPPTQSVLAIDVGGTHVKFRTSEADDVRRFNSGPTLTAAQMCSQVASQTRDWDVDVVSIGYPGPVLHGMPLHDPRNLGGGWVGFDFAAALSHPVKLLNDAAMQALGSLRICPTASAPMRTTWACADLSDSARRNGANTSSRSLTC
jgi:polyphosphate glucokinase